MTVGEHSDASTGVDIVQCSGVDRVYGGAGLAVTAVRDVTCRVRPAARIALTGRSGSGKSTLLHLIGGLDTPSRGTIGWPALGMNRHGRLTGVGLVFQGASLLDDQTVIENVSLPMLFAGMAAADAERAAAAALTELGIGELGDRLPGDLSSGQAQRVAIARLLASRPQLILADEPTGRLDRHTGERVVTALLAAAEKTGAAVIIATHDEAVAGRLATRWNMLDGRLDPIA